MMESEKVVAKAASNGADDGPPRALEDEELEAVAGGGSWTISFDCCADSFAVSGATFDDALSQARTAHDQSNPTHGSSASYSAS